MIQSIDAVAAGKANNVSSSITPDQHQTLADLLTLFNQFPSPNYQEIDAKILVDISKLSTSGLPANLVSDLNQYASIVSQGKMATMAFVDQIKGEIENVLGSK